MVGRQNKAGVALFVRGIQVVARLDECLEHCFIPAACGPEEVIAQPLLGVGVLPLGRQWLLCLGGEDQQATHGCHHPFVHGVYLLTKEERAVGPLSHGTQSCSFAASC
ncbi:hypothetical protein D3C81_1786500 [compost metagenome]